MEHTYEKLGIFYIGKEVDPGSGERTDDLILYDSKDLTTHGVIIGMTGSGKTGLGIGILEEAAMDRIPVIAIDPKGDLTNLLLTFPNLAPADFLPWVNKDVASQQGMDLESFSVQQADLWRKGLAEWHQDGERIRRLREHAEFSIYTPGSSAGLPVSVLNSFDAPARQIVDDLDAFRERIQSMVTGLLGLLGIDADPIRSREHILLSSILDHAWRKGQNLDLGALIQAIQQPPFSRLGVMELESIYPSKDRFALAMQLNGLLASPGFQGWMDGDPLDIGAMLYTPSGKPRLSIFSIAHLSDAERMFFVTILLSAVLGWMRTQPGTSSLRALIYMDEVFGFFPPVANPPSKTPMLTLLKQARAFGVGMLLATQNPVDLDYKGLGNTGTWFIGRLQTERDKARVLEALEGAMVGSNLIPRADLDRLISGLGKRVFLMHNVHRAAPTLFTTRWVMSYMAGPLTQIQIRDLMEPIKAARVSIISGQESAAPLSGLPAA
ncbi:MAG: ATP-binding protein, partial [Anaerolineales bacterium]